MTPEAKEQFLQVIAAGDVLGAHYPQTDGIEFAALDDRPAWMYLREEIAAAE